ncbi:MAG: GGDEF domain-containing protein, partial [Burkholderiaceae bacterium]|nr:GGDEF domain-containing protein [Burkholderiaceae bacterium]
GGGAAAPGSPGSPPRSASGAAAAVPLPSAPAAIARAAMLDLSHRQLPPTPENYARAWAAASGEPEPGELATAAATGAPDAGVVPGGDVAVPDLEEIRGARRNARLSVELTEMIKALCDTVTVLAEDESWVKGQIDALRELLAGEVDHVSLSEFRGLLKQTSQMQRDIAENRRAALRQLKSTISDLATMMAGLIDSTDQFGARISAHASEIEDAGSISSLSTTVGRLLADTREMKVSVDASRADLDRSHVAATTLGREVARLEEELAAASAEMVTDHLTQTMNRRGLEEAFAGALARARVSGRSLSVSLIDVDNFKKLNDSLGHQAGDAALKHLATILKEKLRPTDAVARYGGEEFVILLAGADAEQARATMVRVQRDLSAHVFLHDQERRFITFSAGVTVVVDGDTLVSAVGRADDAMYQAKRDGKNCVRVG